MSGLNWHDAVTAVDLARTAQHFQYCPNHTPATTAGLIDEHGTGGFQGAPAGQVIGRPARGCANAGHRLSTIICRCRAIGLRPRP